VDCDAYRVRQPDLVSVSRPWGVECGVRVLPGQRTDLQIRAVGQSLGQLGRGRVEVDSVFYGPIISHPIKQDRCGQIWPLLVPRMFPISDLDPKTLR
jgi:hypothetical protein